MNLYYKGQKIRCSVAFTVNSVATDPTTVTFKVRTPAGTVTTYTYGGEGSPVLKSSTGNYYADVSTDASGEWLIRWSGTGACEAVQEDAFFIETRF